MGKCSIKLASEALCIDSLALSMALTSVQTHVLILLCRYSVCLFTTAVHLVTTDDGFSVPSPVNQKAVETASALTLWCD